MWLKIWKKEEREQRQPEIKKKNSDVETVEFIVVYGEPKRTDGRSTDEVNYE